MASQGRELELAGVERHRVCSLLILILQQSIWSSLTAGVGLVQRYFGTAIGKGRQSAKTDIEKLKLTELSCRQGVVEVAKM